MVGDAVRCSGELLSVFTVEERQGFALADVSAFGFFPAEPPLFLSVQPGGVGSMVFCKAEKKPTGRWKKVWKIGRRERT